jgi:hypothetical protein
MPDPIKLISFSHLDSDRLSATLETSDRSLLILIMPTSAASDLQMLRRRVTVDTRGRHILAHPATPKQLAVFRSRIDDLSPTKLDDDHLPRTVNPSAASFGSVKPWTMPPDAVALMAEQYYLRGLPYPAMPDARRRDLLARTAAGRAVLDGTTSPTLRT